MQGTVATFDPGSRSGSVLLDDGLELDFAAAALAGLGFSRGPWPLVRAHVDAGTLTTVLEDYEFDDLGIYAVYPHRERMPAKLRAFIDHLVAWYNDNRKAGRPD